MKERGDRATLQLPPDDYIAFRVDAMNLKNCLPDVETDCRDRLHAWLLRIVGASTAPTSMALTCRWRSRPQHHKRMSRPQNCDVRFTPNNGHRSPRLRHAEASRSSQCCRKPSSEYISF